MVSASGGLCPPDPLLMSSPTPQHPYSKNLPTPLVSEIKQNFPTAKIILGGDFNALGIDWSNRYVSH